MTFSRCSARVKLNVINSIDIFISLPVFVPLILSPCGLINEANICKVNTNVAISFNYL